MTAGLHGAGRVVAGRDRAIGARLPPKHALPQGVTLRVFPPVVMLATGRAVVRRYALTTAAVCRPIRPRRRQRKCGTVSESAPTGLQRDADRAMPAAGGSTGPSRRSPDGVSRDQLNAFWTTGEVPAASRRT
jgi:hypothetical protein